VEHATRVWKRLTVNDIFPRGRLHGAWRFVEKRRSVFAPTGLERLVRGFLRFERLEDAMVPLVVVATRVDDGAEVWLSEGPAGESVLASAALPGLYPPVELGGHLYMDGGVLNNAPLSVALAAGAKRVYLLLCGTIRSAPRDPQRPFEALLSAFNTSLHARVRRDLAAVPPDVDVIVVEAGALSHIGWEDFTRAEELIEHGYNAARAALDRYGETAAGEDSMPDGVLTGPSGPRQSQG
jgi:NTE family protein